MATSNAAQQPLSFEQFVDAAMTAAIRTAARHSGTPLDQIGKQPVHLPFPIWVGIVAGPFAQGAQGVANLKE